MVNYDALPDIEQDEATHIFETSSVELVPENVDNAPSASADGDIITDLLSAGFSQDAFRKASTLSSANFSGNVDIKSLGTCGYSVSTSLETTEERLARIERELHEISLADASPVAHDGVRGLLQQVTELKDSKVPASEASCNIGEIIAKLSPPSQSKSIVADLSSISAHVSMLELEERIHKLESLVGHIEPHTTSISSQISDLSRTISLCSHPEYNVEEVKKHVEELTKRLSKLESQRKVLDITKPTDTDAVTQSAEENEVVELYKLAKEAVLINEQVPALATRLRLLRTVHDEMSSNISLGSNLEKAITAIQQDMTAWTTAINQVQEKIQSYADASDQNRKAVLKEIASLTEIKGPE